MQLVNPPSGRSRSPPYLLFKKHRFSAVRFVLAFIHIVPQTAVDGNTSLFSLFHFVSLTVVEATSLFRISSLVLRASGQRPAFGFDWVCSPEVSGGADFHNPLLKSELTLIWAFGKLGLFCKNRADL
jgi:hypothetical protein